MHAAIKALVVGMGLGSATALVIACSNAAPGGPRESTGVTATALEDSLAGEGDGDEGADANDATGALVRMDLTSTVGLVLDDIPAGRLREAAAFHAIAQNESFWVHRAERQLRLATYRLVFRGGYYPSTPPRGPLPLPPPSTWRVRLLGEPQWTRMDGHDIVAVRYAFRSTLVTDAASPAAVEPALAAIHGTWDEPLVLPADPELLFERTGYACMNEFEFPAGSVFEENTWYFYDQTCTASPGDACHVTATPVESCDEALTRTTGRIATSMRFTRVPYGGRRAAAFRVGTVTPAAKAAGPAPDLAVVREGLTDERAIVYRFFAPGSCELGEGVIGTLGWRRLLTFSAIVRNDGTGPMVLGDPTDPNNPYVQSNAFEFSACHQHYHFSHYGTFGYAGVPGSKRAFCLEETNRYHNDETTPLTATHQSCNDQGIGVGWGDEYNFGIPGQWVDITGVDTMVPHDLTFRSNPDEFLCEGTPALDAQGKPIFDPSPFVTASGLPVTRIRCNALPAWDSNNFGSAAVSSPGGSFVTEPCTRGQIGPKRNCGFRQLGDLHSCAPGSAVRLMCSATGRLPQVLRVCETSAALGVGVACTLADAVASVVVEHAPTAVTFACPAVRDAATTVDASGATIPTTAPGVGGFSVYQTPLETLGPSDAPTAPAVACTGW